MDWQTRYQEWKALFDYATENREELERKGRMRAFVFCLQRHWKDMLRLGGEQWVNEVMDRWLPRK